MTGSSDPGLSVWGWGEAARFADRDTRIALGQVASALLGFAPTGVSDPAPPDAWVLPRPGIAAPGIAGVEAGTADRDRARHTWGRSYPDIVSGFVGDFSPAPDLVLRPADAAAVARVLDWASSARVAVIPFGGGSSVVGGVTPDRRGHAGAVSLDLCRLSGVWAVDEVSRLAHVGAGTFGPALTESLGQHGLTFRHYPQSFAHSTVGGWVATRAGGHYATGRTHIDDLVAAVGVETPRGRVETPLRPASGAGPEPLRMWLGSEGTLGVVTDAWLRVEPAPAFRGRATVRFASWEAAVAATRAIAQSSLWPSNCRLLDAGEAALHRVAGDGSHVLIVGFESAVAPVDAALTAACELAAAQGGRVRVAASHGEGDEGSSWKAAFVDAPYLQTLLVSLGVLVDTFETCCTWSAFAALHAAVVDDLTDAMQRVCGAGRVTCRFTHVYADGPAPYYTFVAPTRFGSEVAMWRELKAAASEALQRHGGTITHHHAVGRMHRPWYDRERPALFAELLGASRRSLDPAGILNPGVLTG